MANARGMGLLGYEFEQFMNEVDGVVERLDLTQREIAIKSLLLIERLPGSPTLDHEDRKILGRALADLLIKWLEEHDPA